MARSGFKLRSGNSTSGSSFKMMGSSPAKNLGAFVDGVRVPYDEARAVEDEGGNVIYTNDEADKRNKEKLDELSNKENLSSDEKSDLTIAKSFVHNTSGDLAYEGEEGEEAQHLYDKQIDRKAQHLIENPDKINKRTNSQLSNEVFVDRNKNIKTHTIIGPDGNPQVVVKGASKTLSTKGAHNKKGVKSKEDFDKEAADLKRDKQIAAYNAKIEAMKDGSSN